MSAIGHVRPPAVAGLFYPAEQAFLTETVDQLLSEAGSPSITGSPIAIIAPHAGYQYSGLTAAHAYAVIRNISFDTIVIVSPSHCEYFDGVSVFDGSAYATPLGIMKVNEDLRTRLTASDPIIRSSSAGHREEHALEVQLPFIQRLFRNVSLLPIVMGDQRREYCFHLGERLGEILAGTRSVLVASSDLSHYHRYEVANNLDGGVMNDLRAFDEEKLMKDLETNRVEACGGGPMVAIMAAARRLGADCAQVLHHCNSGDVGGDRHRVVGYLAAALHRAQ